ncbi:hypothetical protein D3C81_2162590 [compost metagenome]
MSRLEVVNYSSATLNLLRFIVVDITTVLNEVHNIWVGGNGVIVDTPRVPHLVTHITCHTTDLRS